MKQLVSRGLEVSNSALMDGSVGHSNWFYAVGSHSLWRGGIPSYAKSDNDNLYPQQAVELYVADPNPPCEPSHEWNKICDDCVCDASDLVSESIDTADACKAYAEDNGYDHISFKNEKCRVAL